MLGAADAELLFDTTDALAAGDARAALEAVERLARSGRDPGQFARDLIAHLRQLLVARATGEVPDSFTVTVAQPERLAGQAEAIDDAKLMGAIDALSAAPSPAMREGDDPRLTLEVALLKVATPSLDSSREALLRRSSRSSHGCMAARAATSGPQPAPRADGRPLRPQPSGPERRPPLRPHPRPRHRGRPRPRTSRRRASPPRQSRSSGSSELWPAVRRPPARLRLRDALHPVR